MMNLKNKTAFITGGSKGIGYGIAEALLAQGVNVALTSRDASRAEETLKKIQKTSDAKVKAYTLDVRDYKQQQEVVAKVIADFGAIDFVIANAGIGHFADFETLTPEQWQETIDTNLSGVFYTAKACLESLKETQGYFISISSLAGTNFFPTASAYNASKFGVTGFTQSMMLDVRKHGISVSTIMPGSVSTHFNGNNPEEKLEAEAWKIQKEDIGELVVDLFKMNKRALPSKIEIRPAQPPTK
ncbi:SDR family oxidoreductase [Mesonia hippocampi]